MPDLTPESLAEGRRLLEEVKGVTRDCDWTLDSWLVNHAPALLDAAARAEKAEAELARLQEENAALKQSQCFQDGRKCWLDDAHNFMFNGPGDNPPAAPEEKTNAPR